MIYDFQNELIFPLIIFQFLVFQPKRFKIFLISLWCNSKFSKYYFNATVNLPTGSKVSSYQNRWFCVVKTLKHKFRLQEGFLILIIILCSINFHPTIFTVLFLNHNKIERDRREKNKSNHVKWNKFLGIKKLHFLSIIYK